MSLVGRERQMENQGRGLGETEGRGQADGRVAEAEPNETAVAAMQERRGTGLESDDVVRPGRGRCRDWVGRASSEWEREWVL